MVIQEIENTTKGAPFHVIYDTDNRLSSLTRTIGTKSYATGYSYTTANQLTQLTYPSTRALNINHDSIGRLSSVVNNSDSANYLSSIGYNSAGQTTGWTLGSNIAESFGYSSTRLQMTSQTVTQSGSTRLSLSYSYAASSGQMGGGSTAGNAGQLMSVSGSIGGQTESAAYTYDNVGRLVTSNQTSNGASAQRRFVYDRWGNRTEVWNATSGGSQIQSVSLDQSGGIPTNRITSVTEGSTLNYTYDAAGNVTNDGSHSFTYDAENRVVSVDSGSTATYSYDHQNRRVKKVVGSTTTHYVWQGGQVIAEHNGSTGAVIVDYIFAGSRMIAREQSGRIFFLYDRLSARATITDGQGSIQGRQSHLPFGEELVATGTTDKHRFTSYERDSETGTDYAVNRGYSASIGRFLQADPHRASAGIKDPKSWNRYSYTRNDPTNRIDALGLEDGLGGEGGGDPLWPLPWPREGDMLTKDELVEEDEEDAIGALQFFLKRAKISGEVREFSFGQTSVSFRFSHNTIVCDTRRGFILDLFFSLNDTNADWSIKDIKYQELNKVAGPEIIDSVEKRISIQLNWKDKEDFRDRIGTVTIFLEAKKGTIFQDTASVKVEISIVCRD